MASPAFLAAAKSHNRKACLLMTIESINAVKKTITTRGDWEACALTDLVSALAPGSVSLVTDGDELYSGSYSEYHEPFIVTSFGAGGGATTASTVSNSRVYAVTAKAKHIGSRGVISLQGRLGGGSWTTLQSLDLGTAPIPPYIENPPDVWWVYFGDGGAWVGKSDETLPAPFTLPSPGLWDLRIAIDDTSFQFVFYVHVDTWLTSYLPTGSVVTDAIDMEATPAEGVIFQVDDVIPYLATLTYTVRGSADAVTWTGLGTVTDGGTLDAYRYYEVTADFVPSPDGQRTPILSELRLIDAQSAFDYIGTHPAYPVRQVKPYLTADFSSLSSKIELMKLGTTSEIGPKLHYNRFVADMIATGYLRNKALALRLGFEGLSAVDFEPVGSGIFFNWKLTGNGTMVDVQTRSVMQRFQKVQLPVETVDGSGNRNAVDIEWSGVNIIQVMLDIIDMMGIPDRNIDRAAANALISGARSGSDWLVSRTLTKDAKEDAVKLLEELVVLSGVFFIQLPDGRLSFVLYDPDADPVAEFRGGRRIEADGSWGPPLGPCKFGDVDGNMSSLFTRQEIFYSLITGKDANSTTDTDFEKALLLINATAEINWGLNADVAPGDPSYLINPGYEKKWYDHWGASPAALEALANRMDAWFANPKALTNVEAPLYHIVDDNGDTLTEGKVVAVTGLQLPCAAEDWPGQTVQKKFLVMSRKLNTWPDLTLSFDLMEV